MRSSSLWLEADLDCARVVADELRAACDPAELSSGDWLVLAADQAGAQVGSASAGELRARWLADEPRAVSVGLVVRVGGVGRRIQGAHEDLSARAWGFCGDLFAQSAPYQIEGAPMR